MSGGKGQMQASNSSTTFNMGRMKMLNICKGAVFGLGSKHSDYSTGELQKYSHHWLWFIIQWNIQAQTAQSEKVLWQSGENSRYRASSHHSREGTLFSLLRLVPEWEGSYSHCILYGIRIVLWMRIIWLLGTEKFGLGVNCLKSCQESQLHCSMEGFGAFGSWVWLMWPPPCWEGRGSLILTATACSLDN